DLISKILFKIISAPITFGAITFALSRIQSNLLVLVLLIGLFATSILIYHSLKSHFLDLKSITQQLETKTFQIKNLEFFKENDDEINELENYLSLLKGKIRLAITFIISSFLLTFLFTLITIFYPIFKQLELFWKDYNLNVFNNYNWVNLGIAIIFTIYSLLIIFNSCKKMYRLYTNANLLSFRS
ncbi:hypothetical protein, partial [Mesonia sp.]|uniref:hypothetical protein n=1 Tax=Mesonia sp. TaxID=1960830 RepID=UPI0025C2B4D4